MEIKIQKKELLQGLSWTQSVVDRKATMPILANCCLHASGKLLTIRATDLEVGIMVDHAAEVVAPGAVAVAARALFDIVKELPDERVHLKTLPNHWITIVSGKSKFKIVGLSADEFPKLPDVGDGDVNTMDVAAFHDMIAKTAYAMSTDETRYNLNGVLLEYCKPQLRMVATDGHRLACVDRPVKGTWALDKGVLIPRKGIMEWKRLLDGAEGDFSVRVDPKHVTVHRGNVTLIVRLIDGQFPPYQQVIPKEHSRLLSVDRMALHQALRRVMLVTTDRSRGVCFRLSPGHLELSAKNADVGEAHEELKADYKGETYEVGFNVKYFLDVLNVLEDEKAVLAMKGDMGPCLIRSEADPACVSVVMPMRL